MAEYTGVFAHSAPPDAVTAFAAANIAGSEMMATGLEAFRLGIGGFLVPFAFVYHQELLLKGSWPEIVYMSTLAAAVVGYARAPLLAWERCALLGAAGLMIVRGPALQVAGLAMFAAVLLFTARRAPVPSVARL